MQTQQADSQLHKSDIVEVQLDSKKTRLSKDEWVKKSHYDEILSSWDLHKCLQYLRLSQATQKKLPGCENIHATQIRSVVRQRICVLTNNPSTEQKFGISDVDLVGVEANLNLQQLLLSIAFAELTLPPVVIRINGSKDSLRKDIENLEQISTKLMDYSTHRKADVLKASYTD